MQNLMVSECLFIRAFRIGTEIFVADSKGILHEITTGRLMNEKEYIAYLQYCEKLYSKK